MPIPVFLGDPSPLRAGACIFVVIGFNVLIAGYGMPEEILTAHASTADIGGSALFSLIFRSLLSVLRPPTSDLIYPLSEKKESPRS